jgi:hypothetical protein
MLLIINIIKKRLIMATSFGKNKSKKGRIKLPAISAKAFFAILFSILIGGVGGYFIRPDYAESGYFDLCLNSAHGYCIRTDGPGNIAHVDNTGDRSGFIEIYVAPAEYEGNPVVEFQNESGRCLENKLGSGGDVTVANGPCNGANGEMWAQIGQYAPYKYLNLYRRDKNAYLGSYPTNGAAVYDMSPYTTYYYGWYYGNP